MSMRPGERVSFILSGLNREQPSARRRGGVAEDDVRSPPPWPAPAPTRSWRHRPTTKRA